MGPLNKLKWTAVDTTGCGNGPFVTRLILIHENCAESSWSIEEGFDFDNTFLCLFVCLWPSSRLSSECTVILRQPIHHNRNSIKDVTNCGTGTVDKNVQNKTKLLS